MANRHEYDPLLRVWTYGGPGTPGFDHNADGWNFWCGDVARGLVGTHLGGESKDKKLPDDFDNWSKEQKDAYWGERADQNLSPKMKQYLLAAKAARLAAVEAGLL